MHNLKEILLILSITGIILSVILLYFNARKFKSSIYLGSFFFLIGLYGLIQYVLVYSSSVLLVSIFYFNFSFTLYLIGPMLFWYVRSILTDDSRFKKRDLWHLLPALIFCLTSLPYLFTPYPYKVEIASKLVEDISNLRMIKPSALYDLIPGGLIYMSRPLLVLGYALWSAGMFISYLRQGKVSSVFSHQRYMIKWLTVLLLFLIILVVSHFILMSEVYLFHEFRIFFTLSLLQVISGVGLAGLLISPFFFPGILYGLPRVPSIFNNSRH